MIEFLVKSNVAMAALLGLYYILFEKEKMHHFKRFYLLSALAFSFILPFVTVITYVKEVKARASQMATLPPAAAAVPAEQPADYLFYISLAMYALITLVLAIRFIRNIRYFAKKVAQNPSIAMGNAKLILLEEKVLPHTFLSCIFVNREEYDAKKIESELYTHEYTHVRQKHTLDILFIEILRIIFWFNPLLYCYKKSIQLNHEFLADEKVIDTTTNAIYYQNLLLEKATVSITFSIASNLTFSLTKKRLVMMTKTTSAIKASLLKIAIVPVIAGLMLLYCTKTIAQESLSDIPAEKINAINVTKKVTQYQVDSLRKANPKVYKSKKTTDYQQTSVSYTNTKGKPANKNFFTNDTVDKKVVRIQNGISDIPADKIKTINVYKNVTQHQVDSLKQAVPKTYVSNNPRDYGIVIIEYSDKNDKLVKKKFFAED